MTFSPQLLNNKEKLIAFFQEDKALKEVQDFYVESIKKPYFGRWNVVWIIFSSPFKYLFLLISRCFNNILSLLSISPSCLVNSVRNTEENIYNKKAYDVFKKRLLVPSNNNEFWVRIFPSITRESIIDPQIRNELSIKTISFDNPGGSCGGGVLWFNFLFLKNYSLSCDPKKLAIAVAQQFKTEIPLKARLLQSLKGLSTTLLKMTCIPILPDKIIGLLLFIYYKGYAYEPKNIIERIQNCKNGCYLLGFNKHGVSLLKFDQFLAIWDINFGLIEMNSTKDIEEFFNIYEIKRKDPVIFGLNSLQKNLP